MFLLFWFERNKSQDNGNNNYFSFVSDWIININIFPHNKPEEDESEEQIHNNKKENIFGINKDDHQNVEDIGDHCNNAKKKIAIGGFLNEAKNNDKNIITKIHHHNDIRLNNKKITPIIKKTFRHEDGDPFGNIYQDHQERKKENNTTNKYNIDMAQNENKNKIKKRLNRNNNSNNEKTNFNEEKIIRNGHKN